MLLLCIGRETALDFKEGFSRWIQGCEKLAVMGVGNPLRRDDGVGVEIVKQLSYKVPEHVRLFECGLVPEDFILDVEAFQPTHILIIDAAELNAEPGEATFFPPQKIGSATFSSHVVPLSLFVSMIKEATEARVAVLGIQPASTEFGEELTPNLRVTVKEVAEAISKALKEIY